MNTNCPPRIQFNSHFLTSRTQSQKEVRVGRSPSRTNTHTHTYTPVRKKKSPSSLGFRCLPRCASGVRNTDVHGAFLLCPTPPPPPALPHHPAISHIPFLSGILKHVSCARGEKKTRGPGGGGGGGKGLQCASSTMPCARRAAVAYFH